MLNIQKFSRDLSHRLTVDDERVCGISSVGSPKSARVVERANVSPNTQKSNFMTLK